jgi:hypothetical protein
MGENVFDLEQMLEELIHALDREEFVCIIS